MTPTDENSSLSEIETDLINCLLTAPTIDYLWNPADPDAADFYTSSDCNLCLEDRSDAELYDRFQSLSIWGESL